MILICDAAVKDVPPQTGEMLSCPACSQQMAVPIGEVDLPLHMYRGAMCLGAGTKGAPPKFGEQIREPLTIPAVAALGLSEILAADTCLACGRPKAPGQTVCTTCHGFLPFPLQRALPPYMRHYLYADEKKELTGADEQRHNAGRYTRSQFTEVFQSCLQALADLRADRTKGVPK